MQAYPIGFASRGTPHDWPYRLRLEWFRRLPSHLLSCDEGPWLFPRLSGLRQVVAPRHHRTPPVLKGDGLGGFCGCCCLVRVGLRLSPPWRGVAPVPPWVFGSGRPPAAPALAGGSTGAALGQGPASASAAAAWSSVQIKSNQIKSNN